QADMEIPEDFLEALEQHPVAKQFFETLDRKNLYPIYYRLKTAKKPETRASRMEKILDQLNRREKFH
ncbi:MAG: YdeI/OmpD-associated family protein, partial [Pseudomonadota bacterium]